MAKLKMKCISIAVMNKDKKRLVSRLQKFGAVELKQSKAIDGFSKVDYSAQRLVFDRAVQSAEQALKILDQFAPEKKGLLDSLNGRRIIDINDYYEEAEDVKKTLQSCYDIIALDKQLGECKAEIAKLNINIEQQNLWTALDVPTNFAGTLKTKAVIGSFNKEYLQSDIMEMIASQGFDKDYSLEIVASGFMQTNIFAVCLSKDAEEFDKTLRALGFAYIGSGADDAPIDAIKRMTLRRDSLITECDVISSLIETFSSEREKIKFAIDYYSMRVDRYKVYGDLLESKRVTLIEGYIPEINANAIVTDFEENFSAAVEIYEPSEDDDIPVALKNNSFNRPCESTVTMFAAPGRNDVDPTSSMAFFFYLFFGMMLSDAGYGLLIVLATAFVLKKFTLEHSMRNSMKMFFYCGISTMFWGFLFGGFFGDLIPKFAEIYLGKTIAMPKLLDPINDALILLVLGLGLGLIHIFVGMAINFANLCKQGKVLDAIFDVGLWFVTIIGMVMAVATLFADVGIVGTIGVVLLAIGIAGLVLTQGRSKKGFGKVISGVASVYDITSYASDILSYCRLMALGLATGVFAQVINQLGMSNGIIGFITFILIFVVGNLISFAMNALGAYVHTIRLQYVEYFSKFYEGGGRNFEPFAPKTKYVRFKENNADR